MITLYSALARLEMTLTHQGIPYSGLSDQGGKFTITYPPGTPQNIQDQGNAIAATWPTTLYRSRLMWDIAQQLQQMDPQKLNEIYGDLWVNTWPPKLVKSEGANSSGIFAMYGTWQFAGTSPGDADICRLYGTAMYIQDNPTYCINPSFDPSISVPGWEPVP